MLRVIVSKQYDIVLENPGSRQIKVGKVFNHFKQYPSDSIYYIRINKANGFKRFKKFKVKY